MTTLHAGPSVLLFHAEPSFGSVSTTKIQYTLVDEDGNTLVDEDGNTLISDLDDVNVIALHAGATDLLFHAED